MMVGRFFLCLTIAVAALAARVHAQEATRADVDFFEAKVRPLLVSRCFSCHSSAAKKTKGQLNLDHRASILRGGESGPAARAGEPANSLLLHAVSYKDADLSMPPQGKLPDHEIAVLAEWVRRGLPFPESKAAAAAAATIDIAAGRRFWSFQPLRRTPPPRVQSRDGEGRVIDAFILAELEKRGLTLSPAAEPRVLVRRLYFDLLGLPPTPEDLDRWLGELGAASNSTEHSARGSDAETGLRRAAVARLVDHLLQSPHYGERWGRYWLDLARYCDVAEPWAESKGKAYLYRDWVVRALNDDMPYDQFVIKQLAADLEPGARLADRAALGFLGLSPSYWKELKLAPDVIKTVVAEEWEERIHTVTSTFLGLTVSCARCHDHKFDPITQQDYYGLAGVFASTKLADRAVGDFRFLIRDFRLPPALNASLDAAHQVWRSRITNQEARVVMAPGVEEAALYVMADGPHMTKLVYKNAEALDVAMQVRGNPANPGAVVPRRFLSVLSPDAPRAFRQGSGRLELAKAIVTEAAPLAARVIVNRVWKQHFGAGLVETPSDFGAQGERPSHPELLDELAARFIEHGWSLKWLHREIVLSATYQQSSGAGFQPAAGGQAGGLPHGSDADNRLLGRMSRRRLDVEAWRDAMLAVAGTLDRSIGGAAQELNDANNRRRTIYGTVKRRELNDLLRLHDFPDPTTHSASRVPTTTPLQQLFTLNSPLVQRQAAALVQRLHAEAPRDDRERVQRAYALLFGRAATERELRLGLEFLGPESAANWPAYAQALLGSNEFAFVD